MLPRQKYAMESKTDLSDAISHTEIIVAKSYRHSHNLSGDSGLSAQRNSSNLRCLISILELLSGVVHRIIYRMNRKG